MSISTEKDYINIFADIFNFYQDKFEEVDSKIDPTLFGTREEFDIGDFFPDIAVSKNIDHGIDSKLFFHSLTGNDISFEKYGLVTEKKGGMIYFESSELIIKKIVTLLGVFTRKKLDHLLIETGITSFQRGKTAQHKKVVFKYGQKFNTNPILEEHLIVIRRLKIEAQSQTTMVPNLNFFIFLLLCIS
jgi:hypothetical protein